MKYLILFMAIAFAQPAFSQASGGNDGGSGGDTYAKEFEMLGRALYKTFDQHQNHPLFVKWHLKPSLFELAINTTLLRSEDGSTVILDNYEVDGINYQNRRLIVINQDRWKQKTLLQKLELVLHEYLGILGIEKGNYIVTNEFTDFIVETYNRIKASSQKDVNLYYGSQKVISPLNSSAICDESSRTYTDALELAKQEALSKCKLYEKRCSIQSIDVKPVISAEIIGYKYCSITAIAK